MWKKALALEPGFFGFVGRRVGFVRLQHLSREASPSEGLKLSPLTPSFVDEIKIDQSQNWQERH